MAPSRRNKIGKGAIDEIKYLLETADNNLKDLIPKLDGKKEEEQQNMFKPVLTTIQKAANSAKDIESISADEVKSIINSIEKKLGLRPDDNTSEKEVNDTYYEMCGDNYKKFGELSINRTLLPIKTKVKNGDDTPTYKDGIYEGPDNESLILTNDYKKFGPDGTENRGLTFEKYHNKKEEIKREPCKRNKNTDRLSPEAKKSLCESRRAQELKKNEEECNNSNACRGANSKGGSRHTRRKRGKSSKRKSSKKSRKTKRRKRTTMKKK